MDDDGSWATHFPRVLEKNREQAMQFLSDLLSNIYYHCLPRCYDCSDAGEVAQAKMILYKARDRITMFAQCILHESLLVLLKTESYNVLSGAIKSCF